MGQLAGKAAIVTGGSSGIGRAIASRYAAEGARVVIGDVTEAPGAGGGAPTAEAIAAEGGTALFQLCDVSRRHQIEALVETAVTAFGRLDVMVNNAAWFGGGKLLETGDESWDRVIAVNLTGMFYGCRAAVAQMLRQEPVAEARGRIVNVTSQHGMISSPGYFAYGVSKAGGVYMTRQIAADYAKDLIICNAVAPGKVVTGSESNTVDEAALAYARSRTPMPRLGRPGDVASAAVFLASDQATYITGVNLMVDGGWMAA